MQLCQYIAFANLDFHVIVTTIDKPATHAVDMLFVSD